MRLSSPTLPVFLVSVALAVLVVAVRYGGVSVPFVNSNLFEVLGLAYVILLAGNLFRSL